MGSPPVASSWGQLELPQIFHVCSKLLPDTFSYTLPFNCLLTVLNRLEIASRIWSTSNLLKVQINIGIRYIKGQLVKSDDYLFVSPVRIANQYSSGNQVCFANITKEDWGIDMGS